MTITLRPRQTQALADVRQAYASGSRAPILVAPTGFGKTATAAEIVRRSIAKGKRVWFLAHLKEILNDTSERLTAAGIAHGHIRATYAPAYDLPVQLVGVATAVRRNGLPRPDLIIIDECHLAVAKSYRQVIEAAGTPRLLGLTGTPLRLDGRGLGEVFDQLVLTCGTAELVDEGLLAPVRVFAPPGVDLTGLKRRCGDYDQAEAAAMMNRPAVVGDALSHWQKLCHGRRGVAFCTSVAHSQAVAEQWQQAGYRAMAVHGDCDDAERREAIEGLRAGRLDLVACAQLWIAGVDVPEIDAVIWLRPTQSLTAWLQGNGRGLRIAPGKADVLILDHVGNVGRLGHPLDSREWSLEGLRKRDKEAAPSVRTCPACFAAVRSPAAECPECGHVFAPERRELEHVPGELVEMLPFEVGDFVRIKSDVSDSKYKYQSKKEFYPIVEIFKGRARLKVNNAIGFWADLTDITYGAANQFKPGDIVTTRHSYVPPNHLAYVLSVNKNMVETASCNAKAKGRVGTAPAENFVLVTRPDPVQERKREQAQAQTIKELAAIGKRRGMKSPYAWAHHVMTAREAKRIAAD